MTALKGSDAKFYLVIMRSGPSAKPLDHYVFATTPEEALQTAFKKWMHPELACPVREVKEEEMMKLVIVTDFSKINNGW